MSRPAARTPNTICYAILAAAARIFLSVSRRTILTPVSADRRQLRNHALAHPVAASPRAGRRRPQLTNNAFAHQQLAEVLRFDWQLGMQTGVGRRIEPDAVELEPMPLSHTSEDRQERPALRG